MSLDLASLIGALNPTAGEIAQTFLGFKQMPSPVLSVLLQGVDEGLLKKWALWGKTFAENINRLGPSGVDPDVANPTAGDQDDFFAVMRDAKYRGPLLNWEVLTEAHNSITMAIKAENWQDAVATAISLAKVVPVA